MIARLAVASAALLSAFHLWLFGQQLVAGQLTDPTLILRWAVAGALISAALVARHRGVSLALGRRAVAFWMLVVLLHGPAVADDGNGFATPGLPESVVLVTQAVAALGVIGLGMLVLSRTLRTTSPLAASRAALAASTWIRLEPAVLSSRSLPRPPPLD